MGGVGKFGGGGVISGIGASWDFCDNTVYVMWVKPLAVGSFNISMDLHDHEV